METTARNKENINNIESKYFEPLSSEQSLREKNSSTTAQDSITKIYKSKSKGRFEEAEVFAQFNEVHYQMFVFILNFLTAIVERTRLVHISNIHDRIWKFAFELTIKFNSKEVYQSKTLEELRIDAKNLFYLRSKTWWKLLYRNEARARNREPYIVRLDEKGNTLEFSYEPQREWVYGEERYDPNRQDPEKITIYKDEEVVIDKALRIMATGQTKNSQKHYLIMATQLGRTDLASVKELDGTDPLELNNLRFHARNKTRRIVAKLCTATAEQQTIQNAQEKVNKVRNAASYQTKQDETNDPKYDDAA